MTHVEWGERTDCLNGFRLRLRWDIRLHIQPRIYFASFANRDDDET